MCTAGALVVTRRAFPWRRPTRNRRVATAALKASYLRQVKEFAGGRERGLSHDSRLRLLPQCRAGRALPMPSLTASFALPGAPAEAKSRLHRSMLRQQQWTQNKDVSKRAERSMEQARPRGARALPPPLPACRCLSLRTFPTLQPALAGPAPRSPEIFRRSGQRQPWQRSSCAPWTLASVRAQERELHLLLPAPRCILCAALAPPPSLGLKPPCLLPLLVLGGVAAGGWVLAAGIQLPRAAAPRPLSPHHHYHHTHTPPPPLWLPHPPMPAPAQPP